MLKYLKPNITKRFSLLLLANFVSMLSQWSVLSVFSKNSDLSFLGAFSLSLAFISPIMMFAGLQLKSIVASDTSKEYNIFDYLRVRIASGFCSLILIIFIAIIFYKEFLNSIIFLAIVKTFESLGEVMYGNWLRDGKVSKICFSTLLKSIFGWGVFPVICLSFKSLEMGFFYLMLIQFVVFIFYDIRGIKLISIKLDIFKNLWNQRDIVKIGFFLGVTASLSSLCINIPRYFIEHLMGNKELGIFTALCYLWIATGYISNSIGDGYLSYLSELINGQNYQMVKRKLFFLLKCITVVTPLILTPIYFAGDEILMFIYSPIFKGYSNPFMLVMLLVPVSFLYTFIVNYYISSRKVV